MIESDATWSHVAQRFTTSWTWPLVNRLTLVLWIKVTPWKSSRRRRATIKRLNKHGKSLSSIGASGGVASPWLGVNLSLGSEAGTPELMGNYWRDSEEISRQQVPCSLTSLVASGCFNVTGDILLMCYFKPWIFVKGWFRVQSWKPDMSLYVCDVQNPALCCTSTWGGQLLVCWCFLSNSVRGFLPQRPKTCRKRKSRKSLIASCKRCRRWRLRDWKQNNQVWLFLKYLGQADCPNIACWGKSIISDRGWFVDLKIIRIYISRKVSFRQRF